MTEPTTILQFVTRAALRHIDTPANGRVVIDAAVNDAKAAHDAGTLADKPGDLVRTWIEQEAKRYAKRGGDQVKARIQRIALTGVLDLGEDFDLPVLVCGKAALSHLREEEAEAGRIVTLGSFADTDADLMRLEAWINLEKQRRAFQIMEPGYLKMAAELRPFINYESFQKQRAVS